MSEIKDAALPVGTTGNDPNDFRQIPNYLESLTVTEPGNQVKEDEPLSLIQPDNEDDLALTFSEKYKSILRYVAEQHRWYLWNGSVWANDRDLMVFDMLRTHCRDMLAPDEKLRTKMLNAATIAATERLVKSDRHHAAVVEQWDANDWILNTPDGIIDLATGEVSPNDPSQHCTKITAIGPDGECPTWRRFLGEITGGDTDLAEYLQRVIGYACTGSTKEHALFFFYGTGGNGKGTFLNPITKILNDYAVTANADVFTESKHEQHPTELARFVGARMVVAQETDEGRKWAEAKIKQLTGGDDVTARFMRQDFFTFSPKFTLIIAGNHKPSIRTVDEAMRRRLHLIPFDVTIPRDRRDPDLAEKLEAELSGIMQWMIDGVTEYNRQGLNPPKSVVDATETYFEDENTIQQWITDCCETGPDYWEPTKKLFTSWKQYATDANLRAGTMGDFKAKLESSGFRYVRTGVRGRHYTRIRLKPESNPVPDNVY